MVAFVSGENLGLTNSSRNILGGAGQTGSAVTGRNGEQVFINSATGNLIIQDRDEALTGLGIQSPLVRTYNSQGLLDDDNADNWRLGVHQRLHSLTGTLNTVGSTITKTFGDGAEVVYTYDDDRDLYVSTDGDGAHDTLSFDSGPDEWTWTDGSLRTTETYDDGGRLTSTADGDGNSLTYFYTGNLLTHISVNSASPQDFYFDYTGTNLGAIRVVSEGMPQTLTQYEYDGLNRLVTVRVDLSPEQNSTRDGNVFVTHYQYDGTSRRIASIVQQRSEGDDAESATVASFTYELIDGIYRVKTSTDGTGKTTTLVYSNSTGTAGSATSAAANAALLASTQPGASVFQLNNGALAVITGPSEFELENDTLDIIPAETLGDASELGANASSSVIRFDQNGNGFATFVQSGALVIRQYNRTYDVWSQPKTLSIGTGNVSTPSLVVDQSGTAVVAWVQSDGTAQSVYASTYDPVNEAWSAAVLVESNSGAVSTGAGSVVVGYREGQAAVAWLQTVGGNINVYAAALNNGVWSAPALLDASASAASKPLIALNGQGNILVFWVQSDGVAQSIYYNRWDPGTPGAWIGATLFASTSTSTPITNPQLTVDFWGSMTATWSQGNEVWAQHYSPSTGLGSPVLLHTGPNAPASLSLSADDEGNAILAWVQSDGTANSLFAAHYDAVEACWSVPEVVELTNQAVVGTAGSVATSIVGGHASVAWVQNDGTHDILYGALLHTEEMTWGAPILLASGSFNAGAPTIALSEAGDFAVVWQQTNGGSTTINQRRYYHELAGPFVIVQAGDTWASITGRVYGVYGETAAKVLRDALGSPTLTAGMRLRNLPGLLEVPAGDGAWSGASQLAAAGSQPKIEYDANGNGFAVYTNGSDVIVRRYTRSTDTWSAATTLDSGSGTVHSASLHIDAAGDAIVGWVQSDGTAPSVYARRFTATTSTWGSATLIESSSAAVSTLPESLAVYLRNGVGVIAWLQTDGTRNNVHASLLSSGSWGSPLLLETSSNNASNVSVGIDDLGFVQVAWQQSDGDSESIYYNEFSPGSPGIWTGATLVEWDSPPATQPEAVFDDGGCMVAAWIQDGRLYSQRYTRSGGMGSVVRVDGADVPVAGFSLGGDEHGNAILAWVQSDGESSSLFASTLDEATGLWSCVKVLEGNLPAIPRNASSLQASINGKFAAIAWVQSDGVRNNAYAVRFNGESWSTPNLLEEGNAAAGQPTIAIDSFGNTEVLWRQSNGSTEAIYHQRYYATTARSWSDPVALESLTGPVSDVVTDAANDGSSVLVWAQGGKLYARNYNEDTHAWSAVELISNEAALAGSVRVDVDFDSNQSIVTWIDSVTGTIRSNRFTQSPLSFDWSWAGAELIAQTPPGVTVSEVSASVNKYGRAAVVWKESAAGTDVIQTRRFNGDYWASTEVVASDTMSLDMVHVVVTSEDTVQFVWRGETFGGYDIVTRAYAHDSWSHIFDLTGSEAPIDRVFVDTDGWGDVNILWTTGNDMFVRWGSWTNWNSADELEIPTVGTLAEVAFSSSVLDGSIVAWTTTEGNVYTYRSPEDVVQQIGSGTGLGDLSVDLDSPGGAVVGWRAGNNAYAQRLIDNVWQGAQLLETAGGNAKHVMAFGTGVSGKEPMAVWVQNDGTSDSLYFSRAEFNSTPIGSSEYYEVQEGDTWDSIARKLYGSVGAGAALQAALGNLQLYPGLQITDFPATLNASLLSVPAYYTVHTGDTWASITLAIYGTSDTNAINALKAATGNPALTNGLHLTVPSALNYRGANGAAVYQQTDIEDPLGNVTTILKDADGRIVSVKAPEVASERLETQFEYDSEGNVVSVTTGTGSHTRAIHFEYDENGNLELSRDEGGNTVTRTYSETNQLLTETVYTGIDGDGAGSGQASGGVTTRYVYDAEDHVRFVVSAEGRVTEYQYDAAGLRTTAIRFVDLTYDISELGLEEALSEGDLTTWRTTCDLSNIERTDYTYDFRGNLASETLYEKVSGAGDGLAEGASTTRYIYDQRGQLLATVNPRAAWEDTESTHFIYDGLGRVRYEARAIQGKSQAITRREYADFDEGGVLSVDVTFSPEGYLRANVFDIQNRLISTVALDQANPLTGIDQTFFTYDAAGRLRDVMDVRQIHSHLLYDAAGRKVASIDGDGTLTQYIYDDFGQLVKTVEYAERLPQSALDALLVPGSNPANPHEAADVSLESLLCLIDEADGRDPAEDKVSRWVYDKAGRLLYTIDDAGAVTQTVRDGTGRIVEEIEYRNVISIARSVDALDECEVIVSVDGKDRHTQLYYDNDGNLQATLDAEGYAVLYTYDGAGRLTGEAAFAKNALGVGGPFGPDAAHDITTRYFYDGQGRRIGVLDAEGYLTLTYYDADGAVNYEVRYDDQIEFEAGDTAGSLKEKVSSEATRHAMEYYYDTAGRLIRTYNFEGTKTDFEYDLEDRVVRTSTAVHEDEERTILRRYDFRGQVTAELTAEGAKVLAAATCEAEVEAAWENYSVRYEYDLTGLLIQKTDQLNQRTLYFYDADNRLTHVINPEREVVETEYDAFGRVSATRVYANTFEQFYGYGGGLADEDFLSELHAARSAGDTVTTTAYGYTSEGRQATTTTGLGDFTTSKTDAFGDETHRIQPTNGSDPQLEHTYVYDRLGQLKETHWDSAATTHPFEARKYDAFGRLTEVSDQYGNTVITDYDRLGRVISTQDPAHSVRRTDYDAFNRVLATYDGFDRATSYCYNDEFRSVVVTTPEGVQITTFYNRHGEVLQMVDGNGTTTEYLYDDNGRVIEVSDQLGLIEQRSYDRTGRQVTQEDARALQSVTRFEYDAASRIITRTVDEGGLQLSTHYQYDNKGNVTDVTDERGIVTHTTYDADGRVESVTQGYGTADASETRYFLDLSGRVIRMVEGFGAPNPKRTIYFYDTLGRRIEEIVDPLSLGGILNISTKYFYDDNGNLVHKIDPENHSTWYVYDANNRLAYTIDALGGVTQTEYDAEGRVYSTRRYATAITPPDPLSTHRVTTVSVTATQRDRRERHIYDLDGRETFLLQDVGTEADPRVRITEKTYDDNGNVTRTRVLADTLAASAIRDLPGVTDVTADEVRTDLGLLADVQAQDRVQWTTYDARNRAVFNVNVAGVVTRNEYDGNGNITKVTEFSALAPPGTTDAVALDAFALAHAADAGNRYTRSWYDGANRAVFTVDPEGYVSESRFEDGLRTTRQIAYDARPPIADGLPLADLVTLMGVNASLTADRETRTEYDAAGRVHRIYGPEYSEALQNYEEFKYDARGNKIEFRNQKGDIWKYEYDAANRLEFEKSPSVPVSTATDGGNSILVGTNLSLELVTYIEYDDLGNVKRRTEAYGTSQARTTEYGYDALGRQTLTRYPSVNYYTADASSDVLSVGWAAGTFAQSNTPLTSETFYDTLGNAIRSKDVADNYSYRVYDRLGRVEYEIDAKNYVTGYTYDTFGNEKTVTRYFNALTTPLSSAATSLTAADITGSSNLVVNSAEDRTITKTYDKLNRLESVSQPAGLAFVPGELAGGAGKYFTAAAVTWFEYNAFGELVRTRELANPLAAAANGYHSGLQSVGAPDSQSGVTWNETNYYYDNRGNKRAEIAADGSLTTFEYDAVGIVKKRTEFADRVTSRTRDDFTLPTARTPSSPNADGNADRTFEFKYDRLNRLIEERMTGFRSSYLNGNAIDVSNADRVSTYAYDAVGNRISETVNGRTTQYFYDKLGRLIATVEPSRPRADGISVKPLTFMKRDAYGNMVEQVQYASGAIEDSEHNYYGTRTLNGLTETLNLIDGVVSLDYGTGTDDAVNPDRVSRFMYDLHGKLVRTEDAMGVDRYAAYTKRGELAKEWQYVEDNSDIIAALVTIYQYDELGRQTLVMEPQRVGVSGQLDIVIRRATQYNAFGEVTQNSTVGGTMATPTAGAVENFKYDQAGHMWRTDSGDGSYKVYHYDLAGRVTAEIRSEAEDLGTYSSAANVAQNLPNTTPGQQIRKITRYDAVGNAIEQISPTFISNGNTYTPHTTQKVDRWGQVVEFTDAAGNTTNYKYDQLGKLIEVKRPTLDMLQTTLSLDGHTATKADVTDRPIERNFYDANGWLIATQDGNGNVSKMQLDAGGKAVREIHADGNDRLLSYNVFGDLVQVEDELRYVMRQGFDAVGRVVWTAQEVVQNAITTSVMTYLPEYTDDEQLVITYRYAYDEAGRRISETNGAFITGDHTKQETTKYWYDLQGNVIQRATPRGNDTYFEYDVLGFGKKTRETNELTFDNTQSWGYDVYGRLQTHTDLGGNSFEYHYEARTGWLDYQNQVGGGQYIDYAYDEAGNVQTITDSGAASGVYAAISRVTDYGYDLAGRRNFERVTVGSTIHQETTTTFDTRGNIATVSDPRYTLLYKYDAANNRTLIHSSAYNNAAVLTAHDYYYAYDNMNRVDLSQAQFASGEIFVDATQGIDLSYDQKGQRKTARASMEGLRVQDTIGLDGNFLNTVYGVYNDPRTETYGYDGLGRLITTDSEMRALVVDVRNEMNPIVSEEWIAYRASTRTYDGASREIQEIYKEAENTGVNNLIDTRKRTSTYDDDGHLQLQDMWKDAGNGNVNAVITTFDRHEFVLQYGYSQWREGTETTVYNWELPDQTYVVSEPPGYTLGWDVAGNLRGYTLVVYDEDANQAKYHSTYSFTYNARDSYLQEHQSVASTAYNGNAPGLGNLHYYYNVNGELVRTTDSDRPDRNRFFANNQSGQAIAVVQGNLSDAGVALDNANKQARGLQSYQILAPSYHYFFASGQLVGSVEGGIHHFDVNITPVSDNYPSAVPSEVVVQEGDTLRTIAARVFGDGDLWYLIATENGITGDPSDPLETGKVLRIPNEVISLSNTGSVYKPFEASTTLGETTPSQPAPPPPRPSKKGGGCGIIGAIIVTIVVIVVAYYTGVYVDGLIEGAWGAAVGAVAGAVAGNVAGQLVGMAIGQQESFSWKSVAASAVTAGILSGTPIGALGGEGFGGAFVQGAINSTVSQGVNIALGLQKSFSWSAVAVSAVGSGVAQWTRNKVAPAIDNDFGTPGYRPSGTTALVTGVAGGLAGGVTRVALGGRMDTADILTDAFGNALGASLVRAASYAQLDRAAVSLLSRAGMKSDTEDHRTSFEFTRSLVALGATEGEALEILYQPNLRQALLDNDEARAGGISDDTASARAVNYLEERERALAAEGAAANEEVLQEVVVSSTRKGPSGDTITGKVFSGGIRFVTGLHDLAAKYERLANLSFEAGKVLLTGGPLKSVVTKLGKLALSEAASSMRADLAERANEATTSFVTEFATERGLATTVNIAGKDIPLTADVFGQAAGQVSASVVDTVFDARLGDITKRGENVLGFVKVGPHKVGTYKEVKGHHPHQQASRSNDPKYNPKNAIAVADDGTIDHKKITSEQRRLNAEMRRSGKPFTAKEEDRIAIQGLIKGGVKPENARKIVKISRDDLRNQGASTDPTRLPGTRSKTKGK